jgi:hypothetical protein
MQIVQEEERLKEAVGSWLFYYDAAFRVFAQMAYNVFQLCEGWAFVVRLPGTCTKAE